MGGIAESASQFISPNTFGYNPEIKRLPYDLEKAKQLMKEAGYENGFEIEMESCAFGFLNCPAYQLPSESLALQLGSDADD